MGSLSMGAVEVDACKRMGRSSSRKVDIVSWVRKVQRRQGSCKLTFILDSFVLQNDVFHLSNADSLILACFHEVERYRPRTPCQLCVLVRDM